MRPVEIRDSMATDGRVLVHATVTNIKDDQILYPCCVQCYSKLHHEEYEKEWYCLKCGTSCVESKVTWRFRLSLIVADQSSLTEVATFGKTLEPYFGTNADNLHKFLKKLDEENLLDENMLMTALEQTFVGQSFYFGIKSNARITELQKFHAPSSPISVSTIAKVKLGQLVDQQIKPELVAVQIITSSDVSFTCNTVLYNLNNYTHNNNDSYKADRNWKTPALDNYEVTNCSYLPWTTCDSTFNPSFENSSIINSLEFSYDKSIDSQINPAGISAINFELSCEKSEFSKKEKATGVLCDNDHSFCNTSRDSSLVLCDFKLNVTNKKGSVPVFNDNSDISFSSDCSFLQNTLDLSHNKDYYLDTNNSNASKSFNTSNMTNGKIFNNEDNLNSIEILRCNDSKKNSLCVPKINKENSLMEKIISNNERTKSTGVSAKCNFEGRNLKQPDTNLKSSRPHNKDSISNSCLNLDLSKWDNSVDFTQHISTIHTQQPLATIAMPSIVEPFLLQPSEYQTMPESENLDEFLCSYNSESETLPNNQSIASPVEMSTSLHNETAVVELSSSEDVVETVQITFQDSESFPILNNKCVTQKIEKEILTNITSTGATFLDLPESENLDEFLCSFNYGSSNMNKSDIKCDQVSEKFTEENQNRNGIIYASVLTDELENMPESENLDQFFCSYNSVLDINNPCNVSKDAKYSVTYSSQLPDPGLAVHDSRLSGNLHPNSKVSDTVEKDEVVKFRDQELLECINYAGSEDLFSPGYTYLSSTDDGSLDSPKTSSNSSGQHETFPKSKVKVSGMDVGKTSEDKTRLDNFGAQNKPLSCNDDYDNVNHTFFKNNKSENDITNKKNSSHSNFYSVHKSAAQVASTEIVKSATANREPLLSIFAKRSNREHCATGCSPLLGNSKNLLLDDSPCDVLCSETFNGSCDLFNSFCAGEDPGTNNLQDTNPIVDTDTVLNTEVTNVHACSTIQNSILNEPHSQVIQEPTELTIHKRVRFSSRLSSFRNLQLVDIRLNLRKTSSPFSHIGELKTCLRKQIEEDAEEDFPYLSQDLFSPSSLDTPITRTMYRLSTPELEFDQVELLKHKLSQSKLDSNLSPVGDPNNSCVLTAQTTPDLFSPW